MLRSIVVGLFVLLLSIYYFESNYNAGRISSVSFHWMGPFYSGGGYGSEAIATITAINQTLQGDTSFKIQISHHGDSTNQKFLSGLPKTTVDLLKYLSKPIYSDDNPSLHIAVCHSEPGAWHPANYHTKQCPPVEFFNMPNPNTTYYKIGRTMFETDRLPKGWADRCNKMDEIWVPAEFHMKIFKEGGVDASKLVKIPEPVDIEEFNRKNTEPMLLEHFVTAEFGLKPQNISAAFKFLSIFKWESRKGWDILLESYFKEFQGQNDVSLYLLTQPYHEEPNYVAHIQNFISKRFGDKSLDGFPHVAFLEYPLPQTKLPQLYRSVDAFVLPSRGEGWGRPHIEAMAMGLPTIATNWSGNLEFMKPWNSYLIKVEKFIEIESGPFAGHFWADPSSIHLQSLLRHVYSHPTEAKRIGTLGETFVRNFYSPQQVASLIIQRINEIYNKIKQR